MNRKSFQYLIASLPICGAMLFFFAADSQMAQAQGRSFGANKFVLDDGQGNTLTLQMPSGLTGPSNYIFDLPIQPNGELPSGYVERGTENGQTLLWDDQSKVWYPTNAGSYPDIFDVPGDQVTINTNLIVNGNTTVNGNTFLNGTLEVTGGATFDQGITVFNPTQLFGALTVNVGEAKIFDVTGDGIDVNGITNLNGQLFANSNNNFIGDGSDATQLTIVGSTTGTANHLVVNGNTQLNGGLNFGSAQTSIAEANPTTAITVVPSTSVVIITGGSGTPSSLSITGGVTGQIITVVNQSTSALTFGAGSNYTIQPIASGPAGAMFIFDGTNWNILALGIGLL